VIGMDAVVFAVGNAKQAAHFYSTTFGIRRTAYRGPETGYPDEAVHVLESGSARFVFSGPARSRTRLGMRVAAHGDGVTDLALEVSSAEEAYDYAVSHGARGLEAPYLLEDDYAPARRPGPPRSCPGHAPPAAPATAPGPLTGPGPARSPASSPTAGPPRPETPDPGCHQTRPPGCYVRYSSSGKCLRLGRTGPLTSPILPGQATFSLQIVSMANSRRKPEAKARG
jgi:hypothetical protein